VWGPPRDIDAAIAVLRQALAAGVNHIDTSDYYGPHVTNQIIKQALHPYERGLVIVTKLGARRLADKSWVHALSREDLIDGVHDNLRNLGLDALDVVNLRVGSVLAPAEGSIEEPLTVLAELQRQGLIRHLGLSNVTRAQLAEAQAIAEIVCVQNLYNRRTCPSRHRLCAVLPAGRVYSAAIFGTGPDGCRTWGDADADRAFLATAALAQYSADPRDVVRQTSS
jgi:aryl-alcohol dehydrogenase-like predicted oxidoreductase